MTLAYRLGWIAFRSLFATYFRWRVYHPERVPASGRVILASNHASFLDPPLVGSGLKRQLNILARDTLFRFPVMRQVLLSWEAVPVDRDGAGAAGLRAILERLKSQGAILLFPEGTRTHDGNLQPARSGIGLTVIKSGAPVVPARVFGTYEAYNRRHRVPRPCRVSVKYAHPLKLNHFHEEARSCPKPRLRAIYQEVADEIMRAIANISPGPDR